MSKIIKKMKTIKIILIAVLFISAYSASAQSTSFYHDGTNLYYTGAGNVGIGTTTPTYLLDVTKNIFEPTIVIHNAGNGGGAVFRMIDDASTADWKFKATATGGFKIRDQAGAKEAFTIEKNSKDYAFYIKAGGNIGIGTNAPTTALTVVGTISSTGALVNGNITCKEVEVTLSGWPDYVFDKEYKLSPLSEVEKYIKENGHLPGISSAKEIEQNGLSLGEMNKQLMQKVEELTLYVIQLQKEVNELKQQ